MPIGIRGWLREGSVNLDEWLRHEAEKPLKVYYDNQIIGDFYVDLFVEDQIVVEVKSVKSLAKEHEVQLVNYLDGMKKDIGLLINFGPSGV